MALALLAHASTKKGLAHEDANDLQRLSDWLLRLEAWRYAPPATGSHNLRSALGTLRREYRQLRWPAQHGSGTL
jgi:hypothetical protein